MMMILNVNEQIALILIFAVLITIFIITINVFVYLILKSLKNLIKINQSKKQTTKDALIKKLEDYYNSSNQFHEKLGGNPNANQIVKSIIERKDAKK